MRDRIEDPRLLIRGFRREDAETLHEAVCESVSEVAPYETWCHEGYSLHEAEEYVQWWIAAREQGTAYYYALLDAVNGGFAGACGLSGYSAEHRHAMLGYWIRSSRTGHGLATHAARRVCAAGFSDLELIRIDIVVPTTNPASLRVAEKLGARREGVLRSKLVLPDGPADVVAFGLLPEELALGGRLP